MPDEPAAGAGHVIVASCGARADLLRTQPVVAVQAAFGVAVGAIDRHCVGSSSRTLCGSSSRTPSSVPPPSSSRPIRVSA